MTPEERQDAADFVHQQIADEPTDWKHEFKTAKAAYERQYKKCWDLCEAAKKYLANDGSNGRYSAVELDKARKELRSAIAGGLSS